MYMQICVHIFIYVLIRTRTHTRTHIRTHALTKTPGLTGSWQKKKSQLMPDYDKLYTYICVYVYLYTRTHTTHSLSCSLTRRPHWTVAAEEEQAHARLQQTLGLRLLVSHQVQGRGSDSQKSAPSLLCVVNLAWS